MGSAFRWLAIWGLAFAGSAGVRAADFQLTPDEIRRVDAREIVIRAALDSEIGRAHV